MNPFVNPRKRSISLPSGCKDLVDVLRRSERTHDSPVRRFIDLVLFQAQQDQATELIVGATAAGGGASIKYKVKGTWHEMSPFPSHIRRAVVAELTRMAKLPTTGQFPSEGVLDATFGGVQLRWIVQITSEDRECVLKRVHD